MNQTLAAIAAVNHQIQESVHQQDWAALDRLHDERDLLLRHLLDQKAVVAQADVQQLISATLVMDKMVMASIADAQAKLGLNALSLKLCQTASNQYQQTAEL